MSQDGEQDADADSGAHLQGVDAVLFLTVCIWGINFSVVKVALAEIPPLAFNSVRYFVVAVLLGLITRVSGRRWNIQRRHLPYLIGLALLGNTVNPLLFTQGAAITTAANAALMLSTVPAWVAVMGALAGLERVRPAGWLGVVLSMAGTALIILGADRSAEFRFGGAALRGDVLVFASTLCWSAYTLLVRLALRHYPSLTVTHFCILIGSSPLIIVGLPELAALDWRSVPTAAWGATLFSGVFAIGLAYQLWNYSVSKLGSARTAFYSNLVPVVALMTAWLGLGETLTWRQGQGVLLAVIGVALARRYTRSL